MIIETKFLKQNYKVSHTYWNGNNFSSGINLFLSLFTFILSYNKYFFVIFFWCIHHGTLGIIDDLLGNRNTTGLKGHIGQLFKFKLTTGGLKALMGGVVSIFVSLSFSNNFPMLILNGLIIALLLI